METGVIIQEPVSQMTSEGANEYLLSKQADETVRKDDIEGPPGLVDHFIKAHEVKIVPDESNGHNDSNGVTIDGESFSGSADVPEVTKVSGNIENEGAEQEKEAATDNNPFLETPGIAKEKAREAEKEAGNSEVALVKQVSNFVEAASVCNEETTVHEPDMVSVAKSLNRDDHGENGKAQSVETISKLDNGERILDDATVDSKTEEQMTRNTEEMHENSKVIGEAVSMEKQTLQEELRSIEGLPIHEAEIVESSQMSMDAPPVNIKEEMVRSCKKDEIEETSNQIHEEPQSSTDKDIEEHVLEESVPKDETIVTETEAVDSTTVAERESLENAETIGNETDAVQTTAAAEEEIPRNAVTIVSETEPVDTTTEKEEKISKIAETVLEETEAVHTQTAAEEKIAKDTELLVEGETTKEGHLEPVENLTKKEMLDKEGEETIENETEAVQTTPVAEEIPRNAETIVNETAAVDTTIAEEEKISKNAEKILVPTEAVYITTAAEEKNAKDIELLVEGETTKECHFEPEENLAKKEMLDKESEEAIENETEAVQTTAAAEEEIPRNAENIVNETEAVDTTTAEEEKILKNAEKILDATAAVHTMPAAEETITKDAELFNEGETKEGHLKPEENLTEENREEILPKRGEETEEKGQESQGSCERSGAATDIAVGTERREGEMQVCEQTLDESRTEPEGKILQEAEPQTIQVTKKEGLELEESPSGIPMKVQTADDGSEEKGKLTEESLKIDGVDDTNTEPEVFIPSKEQVAEEANRTDESQISGQQRAVAPGDLEAEINHQNKTWSGASEETIDQETTKTDEILKGPLEKPVAVEGIVLSEIPHDQTLPEGESIPQMEKASLESSSEGLEQTTKTVDEKIEENPEQAGILDHEHSSAVKTKEGTYPPLESKELGEGAQEETRVDDLTPLQEESCLPKERVDGKLSQKEQTEEHESPNEEIPDEHNTIGEEKSDEHTKIPPALPIDEHEQGPPTEDEKVKAEKAKEAAPTADRSQGSSETAGTQEPNGVPSLPVEVSQPDEKPSSELVSELDEQTPEQIEQILEKEQMEADEIKAEKVPSSEDILQEISGKQASASALISDEEEQVTASDAVMIRKATGEDEVKETNESQEEFPNAAEIEESVFLEEEQHGDSGPSKNDESSNDQILNLLTTIDTSEKLPHKPKEDEAGPQVLEASSKDTDADSGEHIQIPSDVGENEKLEGSDLTKVTEATADQTLLEEKPDEQVESALEIKQEKTPNKETKEGDKETKEAERTVALEGSGTSETLQISQEELRALEAPKLEDKEEDKNQKFPETTQIPEAQADHCLPVETSEPDEIPSSDLVLGLDEQTSKQVEEIHEAKTKESDELQAGEIHPGETIPRESFDDKAPPTVLASGEEEQATASDTVITQESKSEDEVIKRNDGQEEGPTAVETEDKKIGDIKTKEAEEEAKEKLECCHAEEVTSTLADQSHIEEQSEDLVETPSNALSLEKHGQEPSPEATKIEDDYTKETNTGITETVEGPIMSNTLKNVCLNQEEFKDFGAPKQGGITEDQTLLKSESPDDASSSQKTGETEHGVGPSSTLLDVQTKNEFQTMLEMEREARDVPSLRETMITEPAEQTQKASDGEVESNEKDFEPSIKSEDTETEGKHPVTQITESKTAEKQDMKEAEEASAAEKQESSLEQDESREKEKLQSRNGLEEQSLLANELNLQKKHTEEVEKQEEQTREFESSVEEKIQEEEETREIVECAEENPAGHSLLEESPSEKIHIPSSTLPSEEPEHAISTEKQDGTEESILPKNKSREDSRPEDITETLADQNMPEETPDEQVQTQSTNVSTEKLDKVSQIEVMKAHEDGQKEGEETATKAQQAVTAEAVEKTCLQEKQSRDLEASDQIVEAQKPATHTEASRETEQKTDNPEPVEEDQSVDIKEEKKTEEMQDEKLDDPSPTTQKEEVFSLEEKKDHEDATEHGLHHDFTSADVGKEEAPKSALGNEEEINDANSSEKQIIQTPELVEKSGGAEFESNEEIVELQAKLDDTKSEEKHVTADIRITAEQDEENTEEASVAEAKKEEYSQHEQSKEADTFTAEKSTNDLDFPMEQAPKDQIEKVNIEEKQPMELEAHIEDIPADESLTKEPAIEQIWVPTPALPSKQQDHATSTGNHENQVKEYEPATDEPQEGSDTGKMTKVLTDHDFPEENPGELLQAQSSELPLEKQVQETPFEGKEKEDEKEEALAGTRDIDALTTKENVSVQDRPQDFKAPRRDEDTSDQTCVTEESETQLTGLSTPLPDEQMQKSHDLSPVQEYKDTDTKVGLKDETMGQNDHEEPSAREQSKETSLSEEKKELQDTIKPGADHGLIHQTAQTVEVLQQPSSVLASEYNKRENTDTATEIKEEREKELENIEKKNTSEAPNIGLTEPTIWSKAATPKDDLTEVHEQSHGPTFALDNVLKIQAPEMTERNEILQKEIAQEENNDASETSDQTSLPEVTKEIYQENKQIDITSPVTGDILKEKKLSGSKEDISEDTDEVTKEAEVHKIQNVSTDSLSQDACSKIEEQETKTSQKEGCLSQRKDITEEVQKLGETILVDKKIPVIETQPHEKIAEDLQKSEGEAERAENTKGSEGKETEQVEKKVNNPDGKMTESPTSRESARNSLSDLLQKVKEVKEKNTHKEEKRVEEAKTDKIEDKEASHIEEAKTEEEKDEEEDGDEQKEDKTSPDSVVLVEARDLNVKTPHKKSHGILSGVGSKVKHSISKVKKAITGKSSHTKPISPK